MRFVIEAGTDVAQVCCFDPASLPSDFDRTFKEDPMEVMERLANEGRLWLKQTGSDGAFLFHFYVDEEPPPEILAHSHDPEDFERFRVAGGRLFACGAEYVATNPGKGDFETPIGGLEKYSHMGESFALPMGDYTLRAWRGDWPEEVIAQRMINALGHAGWRRHQRTAFVQAMTVCAFFLMCIAAVIVTLMKMGRNTLGLSGLVIAWALVIASGAALPRLLSNLKAPGSSEMERQIYREMPSIVIQLTRISS